MLFDAFSLVGALGSYFVQFAKTPFELFMARAMELPLDPLFDVAKLGLCISFAFSLSHYANAAFQENAIPGSKAISAAIFSFVVRRSLLLATLLYSLPVLVWSIAEAFNQRSPVAMNFAWLAESVCTPGLVILAFIALLQALPASRLAASIWAVFCVVPSALVRVANWEFWRGCVLHSSFDVNGLWALLALSIVTGLLLLIGLICAIRLQRKAMTIIILAFLGVSQVLSALQEVAFFVPLPEHFPIWAPVAWGNVSRSLCMAPLGAEGYRSDVLTNELLVSLTIFGDWPDIQIKFWAAVTLIIAANLLWLALVFFIVRLGLRMDLSRFPASK